MGENDSTFYLTIKLGGDIYCNITLKDVKWLSENVKVKTRLKGATSYNTRFSEFCCCCDRAIRLFTHPANKGPLVCSSRIANHALHLLTSKLQCACRKGESKKEKEGANTDMLGCY